MEKIAEQPEELLNQIFIFEHFIQNKNLPYGIKWDSNNTAFIKIHLFFPDNHCFLMQYALCHINIKKNFIAILIINLYNRIQILFVSGGETYGASN